MKRGETKYPEFQRWWCERLFRRRQFHGDKFSMGKQMWYIRHLRNLYFDIDTRDPYVGVRFTGPGIPHVEIVAWRRARIWEGFNYAHLREMRMPMRALILADCDPLPSARDMARQCNMAWEQFANDFVECLFDMYQAKVGFRGF